MAEDRIRLTGIRATGYHGVLEHERRDGQEFVVDVVLHVDTRASASADRLELTVDYSAVATQVHAVLAGPPVNLVETLAERIAAVALAHERVVAVDVVVHKPHAPVTVALTDVTVEISRSREDPPVVAAEAPTVVERQVPAWSPVAGIVAAALADELPEPVPEPVPLPEPLPPPEPVPSVAPTAGTVPQPPVPPVPVPAPLAGAGERWEPPAEPEVPASTPGEPGVWATGSAFEPEEADAWEPGSTLTPEEADAWEPAVAPAALEDAPTAVLDLDDLAAPLTARPDASTPSAPPGVPPEPAAPAWPTESVPPATPAQPAASPLPPAPPVPAAAPTWSPVGQVPEPAPFHEPPSGTAPMPVPEPAGFPGPVPTLAPEPAGFPGPVPTLAPEPEPEPEPVPVPEPVPFPGPVPVADVVPRDRLDFAPDEPVRVVLALGSNEGPSQETLRRAVNELAALPGFEVTAVAPLARTAAVGGPPQPDFLNTVVLGRTTLSPRALLHACQTIEAAHGRRREERWGPRTLDVDLIVHGSTTGVTDDLELPHPRAHERAFVLQPWAQVDPDAVLPGLGGGPVAALAGTAPDRDGVRWLALDWWTPPGVD
ncbi:2-amino-4-hydroxy-6-hydroxymethyldihydropteridine diphosphokinase [Actinotalea sp. M2MS4P-6]|uniref:2-amino-4-hydroxy-6- hydroxymethyldihydropteridine diphosphokinase n=1 Tax=Actinotalea sp. M2MS4P-6 TaxID=2983762 RepID=UPI0021E3AC08|nr:2-amino-4-hydroxy-6-hydroxymethyldihydropteridine diphosphokinase [Actinotalea sp. M2MS4P-6]MCV2394993.1 2-amino-4-hydroxy-6-hydroxymethyldihydropteridine diphosphokinase [Actinotalea sp. M2MS4P-6]